MSTSPQLTHHREIRLNKADSCPLSRFGISSGATPAIAKVDSSPESKAARLNEFLSFAMGQMRRQFAARRFRPGLRRGRITSPSTSWQMAAMAVWLLGRQCCVSRSGMARYDARFSRNSETTSFTGSKSWNFRGRRALNSGPLCGPRLCQTRTWARILWK